MHQNNFGFLRLLLALLVIVSHSPELIDGDREREYFNMLFGTMSLGDFAVDCFFIISGYLITISYEKSSSLKNYLMKRILRIYPAFVVASLFCFLIIIPASTSLNYLYSFDSIFWIKNTIRIIFLELPWGVEGVFQSVPIPFLNGPVWTIQYEFLCYILTPIFLYTFKNHRLNKYIFLIISLIILSLLLNDVDIKTHLPVLNLSSRSILRLLPAFLIGSVFYLFREKIEFNRLYLCISMCLLFLLMFNHLLAHIGLIVFGSYIIFYFALKYKNTLISSVGTKVDISYGMYLYA